MTRTFIGWRVYGLGVVALGLVDLAFGNFDSGQPVPKDFPFRTLLAYAAAAFLLVTGAAIEWRRATASGAAALTIYYTLVVAILMNGRVALAHSTEFGAYSGIAYQLAVAAGALIIYASTAKIDEERAARLKHVGRVTFAVCAVLFGAAHFVYMNMTAPLVPQWLPPSQEFWGYATGVAHIAGGVAILTGIHARLAAILLTIMYASFTPLVHLPLLLADASKQFTWSENALNIILAGVAWVVADSLSNRRSAA
jgi:uncharacterized membrane protein